MPCVKSVRIRRFSSPYLRISQYSVQMRENRDQKKSEYGHFSRIEKNIYLDGHLEMAAFDKALTQSFHFHLYIIATKEKRGKNMNRI